MVAAGLALTGAILALGPYLAARRITEPAKSSAFWAAASRTCTPRCRLDAAAAIRIDGKLHWVGLGDPGQDRSYYQPGVEIVFDVADPNRAMAEADYAAARHPTRLIILGAATVAAVALATVAALHR